MGCDVHKATVYITVIEGDGRIEEQYEFTNNKEYWAKFRNRYLSLNPEVTMEMSTKGKYVARRLRDMKFSVHLADPAKMPEIYQSEKRNDREDSFKIAWMLRINDLPEVHPTSV
ncbi:MAG: transposase [Thermoplasmatales archaeon]